MIPEWFEMSLKFFSATTFDVGKLKPEYIFKKIIHFFKTIHSKQTFIFEGKKLKYLFKTNIHFF